MNRIRAAYLDAAGSAASLLRDPAVAARWDAPSALAGFGVGGLAGHRAEQVELAVRLLDAAAPDAEPVSLLDHYRRVPWVGAGLDDEVNVGIRRAGENAAAPGPGALAERTEMAVERLTQRLPAEPDDRVVHLTWGPWSLRLDDFLVTRMMEIAVHSDDLAVSVGIDAPRLPDRVLEPVLALLARLAVERHGQSAVLRALGRAERAPASIVAF
jgi:hypothetical protein